MSKRVKTDLTHVYIVEQIVPYDTSEVICVAASLEIAQDGRGSWTYGSTQNDEWWKAAEDEYGRYLLITKHPVRTR